MNSKYKNQSLVSDMEIEQALVSSSSRSEAAKKLNISESNFSKGRVFYTRILENAIAKQAFDNYQIISKHTKYSKEVLQQYVESVESYSELYEVLNITEEKAKKSITHKIKSYEINNRHFRDSRHSYSKLQLENAVKQSYSYTEVASRLGKSRSRGSKDLFRKEIEKHKIDISHFKSQSQLAKQASVLITIPLKEILIQDSTYLSTSKLKSRLYKENLKSPFCEMPGCGQGEEWKGKKMSLILDHINGIRTDNRIENLRIVCPNCDAALPTFAGRNIGGEEGRKNRAESSHKKITSTKLKLKTKQKLLHLRKVERPPLMEIASKLKETSYLALGKEYGVSDNAIRKWVLDYLEPTLSEKLTDQEISSLCKEYKLTEKRINERIEIVETRKVALAQFIKEQRAP